MSASSFPPDLAAMRAAWESGVDGRAVAAAARFGVTSSALRGRARRGGWGQYGAGGPPEANLNPNPDTIAPATSQTPARRSVNMIIERARALYAEYERLLQRDLARLRTLDDAANPTEEDPRDVRARADLIKAHCKALQAVWDADQVADGLQPSARHKDSAHDPPAPWTLTPPGDLSWAAWIASSPARRRAFLDGLKPAAMAALPYLFEIWAAPHQRPPLGPWTTWLASGGRGSGKTWTGAQWVRAEVEGATPLAPGSRKRFALVGDTLDQAQEIMIRGESGLLAVSPPDRRPTYHAGRRVLIWPNGAEAGVFSASDPEALRGPQFDGAWCDELGKWRKAQEAWDMLQFALRLGDAPRQIVTTTPRANPVMTALLADPAVAKTHAPTHANAAWLAPDFIARLEAAYGGTAMARQEIDGLLITDAPGALWTNAMLDAARAPSAPELDRIVVAVDPPAGDGPGADACGIIVAGATYDDDTPGRGRAYVLADRSVEGASPHGWARAAANAYHAFGADRLIAEVNQGGAMVEAVLRQADPNVSYRAVHASRGKAARAEPVAALYEQGRAFHVGDGGFGALEAQMRAFTPAGYNGPGSPDRADALVWALTDLLLTPRPPQVRIL